MLTRCSQEGIRQILNKKLIYIGKQIAPTDGVIECDVEETIKNMERISKEGMDNMDELLFNIMMNKRNENA
jgi:L-cysteine desulfidase